MAKLRITTFEVPNLQFSHRGRRWKEMAVRQAACSVGWWLMAGAGLF
jgi:hypothetical protein